MEELLNTIPVKSEPCKSHNLFSGGYMAHMAFMEEKTKHGAKQKQCKVCGYWLFKSEVKNK
jgi:hypothetical protein